MAERTEQTSIGKGSPILRCPWEGTGAALVLPFCNSAAMSLHLAEVSAGFVTLPAGDLELSENGCNSHVLSRVASRSPIRWRRRYQYSPHASWINPR